MSLGSKSEKWLSRRAAKPTKNKIEEHYATHESKSFEPCQKCNLMFGSLEGLHALLSYSGYIHHDDSALRESVARGCPSCAVIAKEVSIRWDSKGPVYLKAVLRKDCDGQSQDRTIYPSSILEITGIEFTKHWHFKNSKQFAVYKILEYENANDLTGCKPFYHNMGAEEVLRDALQALKDCKTHHHGCKISQNDSLPTRVIDVGPAHGNKIPFLHISEPGERGEYVALSYCWGGPQSVTTTKETFSVMLKGLPMAELPQTFRDVIKVTRQLGIRFLWIDALCIIQDNAADTNHEIDTMGDIYKNAVLTIAANNSPSADSGFLKDFFTSHDSETPSQLFRLPFLLPEGRNTQIALSPQQHHWDDLEPLGRRAWALQESLLSSRLLLFGISSVSWQCRQNPKEGRKEVVKYIYPLNVRERQVRKLPDEVFNRQSEEIYNQDRANIWKDVINDYTNREVTFERDRLSALAGIAHEFQKLWNDDYVAGLWKSRLIEDLLWRSVKVRSDSQVSCPTTYLAPSWSWVTASNHASISFDLRMEHVTAEVIECAVEPVDSNAPLSQLQNGILVLRAKIISATSLPGSVRYCNPRGWHRPDVEGSNLQGFVRCFDTDLERSFVNPKTTYYLKLGESRLLYYNSILTFGLILEHTPKYHYKRIGMFWHGDGLFDIWPLFQERVTIL